MANAVYNAFKMNIMNGSIDLENDTIYVALVTSSYSPDIDTHVDMADITNEVANGNGYTTGGTEVTGKSVSQDNTDDEGVFDSSADPTWATSTITARGAVVYKYTGVTANDLLIAYFDFGQDYSSNNGDFKIQWNSEGILNLN